MTMFPEGFPPSYYKLPAESQLRVLDILEYVESLDLSPEQYRELGLEFWKEATNRIEWADEMRRRFNQ